MGKVFGPLMNQKLTFGRAVVAVMIALIGCVIIWVAVPYNNFQFNNSYISDSFLPEIVIALLLLVALVINPLLRLLGPGMVLNRRQLALIASLLLFAAIVPGNGLMRMFPRFVAESNVAFNQRVTTSKIAADTEFRQELFPDPLPTRDEAGNLKTYETPITDQFLDELDPGSSIPWSDWVLPMALWGGLILAVWMMMLGLAGVVFPQWRDRERLPFPLLNVYQSLTGTLDESSDRALPDIFYSKGFWTACAVVFLIHLFRGLNEFTGSFPSIPLSWDLSPLFSEGIFRNATGTLKSQKIFFALIGVAYFIPNRYAISVWGWVAGFAVYATLGHAFIPAFNPGEQVAGGSFGVLFGIAVWVLWLGRSHWASVGRAMLGRGKGDEESRRDAIAGWTFAIGCAAMMCWLYWAGCSIWWCLVATGGCVIIALLMARIVAETGIPVLWMNRFTIAGVTAFFPLGWQSPQILFFTGIFYAIVTRASGVSAAVITTLALGVDRQGSAKLQSRILLGGLVVLAIGFVISGAVHLNMGYEHAELGTQAKTNSSSVEPWARVDRTHFEFFTPDRGYQLGGLVMGIGLLWACSRFPSWPIHPVGILFCFFSIGNLIWFSIFLGWLLKVLTTSLLGGGGYRKARPVFLGMILGELIALIFWALVPVAIALITGSDAAEISRYTLIRYP